MDTELPGAARHRDRMGIACSTLCVLHCMAPTVLAVAGGSLASLSLLGGEWLHSVLLVVVPGVALWSLLPSFAYHRRWTPLSLAALGLPLLFLAVGAGGAAEAPLSVAGGLTLVAAHGLNWRCLNAHAAGAGEPE